MSPEKGKLYSEEEAREEAGILSKKVESGEAKDYNEAEKQVEQEVKTTENQENPEFREKSEKLFAVVKEEIELRKRGGSYDEVDALVTKKLRIKEEIVPLEKNIMTADDFFAQVRIVDNNILDLEERMGAPVDFFSPQHLKTMIEGVSKMKKRNFKNFEGALNSTPEVASPAFFWAINFQSQRAEDIETNWPAKANTVHLFACRLVGRQLINEVKKSGVSMDENVEKIMLKALPFVSSGHAWKISNEKVSSSIEAERQKAVDDFYKLEQSLEISKIAKNVYKKLKLLDLFRYPDDAWQEEAKVRGINLNSFGDSEEELKKIIRKTQDNEDETHLFGHALPYAIQALDCFYRKPNK